MNTKLQTIYQHDPNIVSRLIGDEMILVPIRQNVGDMDNIYTLNETAARIWELMDGKRDLAEIHQQLLQEFEIDAQQAESDLLELVTGLLEQGAILQV